MPAESDATRSPSRNLAGLRNLSGTSVLLLLTPVMVPSGFFNYDKRVAKPSEVSKAHLEKTDTDPFEHLGRALGKHHQRIRHVPYVPSVGFTETHEAFLAKADGIIIVTCEPEPKACQSGTPEAVLSKQADFAESVLTALDDEDRRVPVAAFHFGDQQRKPDVPDIENVWVADKYTAEAVAQIAQLLKKSSK
ncbi:hypothetical protein LTR36_000061 [Oleoguttula mirabilis]|uniref:Uncharacterized protein n=1 Tax=Oleoguttula mirabilis TaxID=1507867 RepID=A0AAV9JXR6_9PEZI|nr:hypothetical protein LTR36_000061 [Oleoguttula mirabilis]